MIDDSDGIETGRSPEQDLAEQERFFMLSLDLFCILDTGGLFKHANPAFENVLGYVPSELIGQPALELIHPHDRPASEQAMAQIIAGIPITNFVNRFRCLDGSYRTIMWATSPSEDRFYAVGRDITGSMEAQAKLIESQRFLQSTLDALTSHIAVLDEAGAIIAVNKAWREFAEQNEGTAVSCEVGTNYLHFCDSPEGIFADEASLAGQGIRDVMAGRQREFTLEYPCHSPVEQRWCIVSVTRFPGEGPVRVVVSHEDITERREAEIALRESQFRVAGIVEAAMDAIITIDEAQRIVLFNPAAERMFGYTSDQVLGQSIECLIPNRFRPHHSEHVRRFAETGMTSRKMGALGALSGLRADGEEFPIEASISQIEVDSRKLFTVILRDVTERHHAEIALDNRARQQAVVSELGQLALSGASLQQIFDRAVKDAAETLGTEYCKVLELLPDGSAAKVVAGVGWKAGVVGQATVKTGIESQVGFTLLSKKPVIVENLPNETRFLGMPLLHEHNIASGVTVIVGDVEKPFGAMAAHSIRPRKFTPDDVHFFQSVANVLAEAIQRKRTEEALHRSHDGLETRVAERTAELNAANEALRIEVIERQMAMGTLRETADAFQATEQMLRLVMNHIPQAIFWKDLKSIYLGCNDKLAQDAGYSSPAAMLGKSDLDMPWAQHAEAYRADDTRVMESDKPLLNIEEPLLKGDGSTAWLRTNKIPLHDKQGAVVGVLVSYEDITVQKEAEDSIHRAREEAEAANLAKSEFISRMSHELRTPLNAILGFGQVLQMRNIGPKESLSVEHILKAGRHLLQLINEVLDISRIEAGHMSLSSEPINVADIVGEALDLVKPLAAGNRIRLINGVTQADWYVVADRQRLKQVLLNVLANAVKYNREDGQVTVTASLKPASGKDAEAIRLSIRDTGWGLKEAELARLFVPFERLNAEQKGIEGTGIGLSLSKHLVELMGGKMGAESAPEEGSTFWIDFPQTLSPIEGVKKLDTPLSIPATLKEPSTLLYIEDNLSNLTLIEHLFEEDPSISLLSAMQGSIGLDLANQHQPDLILLDVHLPDIPGEEVLRRLRAEPRTRDIPVVIISADATARQIDRLMAAGAREYLTKPLDVLNFLKVITKLLNERQVKHE